MAPNLKHFNLLAAPLADLQVVRPKDYVEPQSTESVSYWDWPSEDVTETVDLFSAEHLQSNLIQAAATLSDNVVRSPEPSNDEYWAEDEDVHVQQPQQADYWMERSTAQSPADQYWDESASQHHHAEPVEGYWNDASSQPTPSDSYWQESVPARESKRYFNWSHERTASDRYWYMTA